MTQDWEPGTVCLNCPHPLDEHNFTFKDQRITLVCESDDGCDCMFTYQAPRPLRTADFNPEAVKALGKPLGLVQSLEPDEEEDQHG